MRIMLISSAFNLVSVGIRFSMQFETTITYAL